MPADPKSRPVTCGCAAGVVRPAGMLTLVGDTVTFEVSALASRTVAPPGGAGVGNVMGNGTDWPSPIVKLAGRIICPKLTTLTFAEPPLYPGALAKMAVDPTARPVTVNAPVVLPAAIVTV